MTRREDVCEDCGHLLDDGEGFGGKCGPCADAAENTPPAPSTELTPIGEQFVIPGCEKNATRPKGSQLDLW